MSREVYKQVLSSQQFALQLDHSAAQSRRPCTWRRLISYSRLNQHWFFYSTDICRIHLGAASQTVSVRHDSQQIHWINSLSCRYGLPFGRVEISDLGSDSTATLHHPRLSRWADFPSVISKYGPLYLQVRHRIFRLENWLCQPASFTEWPFRLLFRSMRKVRFLTASPGNVTVFSSRHEYGWN